MIGFKDGDSSRIFFSNFSGDFRKIKEEFNKLKKYHVSLTDLSGKSFIIDVPKI